MFSLLTGSVLRISFYSIFSFWEFFSQSFSCHGMLIIVLTLFKSALWNSFIHLQWYFILVSLKIKTCSITQSFSTIFLLLCQLHLSYWLDSSEGWQHFLASLEKPVSMTGQEFCEEPFMPEFVSYEMWRNPRPLLLLLATLKDLQ